MLNIGVNIQLIVSNQIFTAIRSCGGHIKRSLIFSIIVICFLIIGLTPSSYLVYADDMSNNFLIMNDIGFRHNADIWARMRADFQLNHPQTDRVKYYERLYTKNPKTFNKMMRNAMPYLYYFLDQVERLGLPAELVLIPGVESTFDPLAKNPGDSYAGMWQFEPITGNRFHLIQNRDIDERRNIIKSTNAAFTYFIYLHSIFKQWEPAIGAYNWGEGNLYKAVVNSGSPLGNVNYEDLDLRPITADYLPKLIALASIIENPDRFGIKLDDSPDQPYFAIVSPESSVTVNDMVNLSQTDKKSFMRLNPQFKDDDYELSGSSLILLPLVNQDIYYASIGRANLLANTTELATNNSAIDAVSEVDSNLRQVSLVQVLPVESSNRESEDSNQKADVINDIINQKQQSAKERLVESSDEVLNVLGSASKVTNSNKSGNEHDLDNLLNTLNSDTSNSTVPNNANSAGIKTIVVKTNNQVDGE